uniref:Leucine-rich repeat-containing N-terminal plant-type domain-containing protein n=1 Tax=Oryza barthii TaxID=65489 RepID=A0A0D3F3L5_9ORYZ
MLLQWKSGLDGQSACLDSWSKNTSPCNWNGVDCSISNESDAVLIGGSGGDKPGRPLPPPSSSASPPPKLSRPPDLCRPGRIWRGGGAAETASVVVAWMVTATTES